MYIANSAVKKELLACLPESIATAILRRENAALVSKASELRLRKDRYQSLTVGQTNYVLSADGTFCENVYAPLRLTEEELRECVFRLCDGSIYAHEENLKKGFLVKNGIRVGIGGKCILKNGQPFGFCEYDSLNFRFPHHIPNAAAPILAHIAKNGLPDVGGILIFSPPNIGKTTFLRALCSALSRSFEDGGHRRSARVCVLDEREEIYLPEAFPDGFSDFLFGCPKSYGIELATRVLSPDILACDEIGNGDEANAICRAASGGILFIATCHAASFEELYRKCETAQLLKSGVFRTLCRLYIENGRHDCEIRPAEEPICYERSAFC